MGEFDEYKESEDTSSDSSEQETWAVTWDLTSVEEDVETVDKEKQYKTAKYDIEMSRSEEERSYWTKRADELWDEIS